MRFLIFLLFSSAICAADETSKWSVEKLNSLTAYHDGANCFNATLAVAGYTNDLIHVSGGEFTFFLDNFCDKRTGTPQRNDFVVFSGKISISHSATYLHDDQVFEKAGGWGYYHTLVRNGTAIGPPPSYRTIPLAEAIDNQNCGYQKCSVETYQCANSDTVKATLAKCDQELNQFPIAQLYAELNSFTLNPERLPILSYEAIQSIEEWATALDHLSAHDFCSMYAFAKSYSLFAYVTNLSADTYFKQSNVGLPFWSYRFFSAKDHFKKAFHQATLAMKKNMHDETTRKILAEIKELYFLEFPEL
jgi:hypothetical protein